MSPDLCIITPQASSDASNMVLGVPPRGRSNGELPGVGSSTSFKRRLNKGRKEGPFAFPTEAVTSIK